MAYITIYSTIDTKENASAIIKELLKKRLIACGNIFPAHTALYFWDNEIQEDDEVSFILKTREDLFEEARELIAKMHPYDCPCIIAHPIMQAHNPFLRFIEHETNELLR
jgi:periplasmic divalent cation tolerance protein